MLILTSLLLLIVTPWFLSLSLSLKFVSFITLGVIVLIKDRIPLNIPSIVLFIASAVLILASVIMIPDVKITVDIQRELASSTPFSKISGIFSNKYIESYRASEDLLFQNLDFGNYFFAGHPRERLGVTEIQKFYAIALFFIIIGFLNIKKDLRWLLSSLFLLAASLSVFFRDPGPSTNFLILPVMVFLGATGLLALSEKYGTLGKVILVVSVLIFCMEGVIFIGPI